ncbi:DeoR/GlpR family DNA-binding transcription regulator [Deinococcus sp. QL22]|uniref:DeoR/GlpR family DNA-binding transcription regulator n=1 Tax=Deinococcus sp. QL22 TaxID=2939437 RepID=UPI0020180425|nr:DeoR/GlpR family DNA-binding transcription regulator [Deinococcus sp. QL22]UQN09628.1 DeoR/GlpR family DNA-binding transcription regulator [Deinococcus sp. QL22]
MFVPERQQYILNELARLGRVEVLDLAQNLGVSEDTVRRDLKALAARGYLQKTHGGAVALDPGRMAWVNRAELSGGAKASIGAVAAHLVEPGQSVLLDAGSTVFELARRLRVRPLTVLTNSLDIASIFASEPDVALSLTGGDWNVRSRYLTGASALETIGRRRTDWTFLGACAVHPFAGVTSVSEGDAAVKRAMLAVADRTVVLADHSKLGQIAPYSVAPLHQMYALVTDGSSWTDQLGAAGVQVLVAQSSAVVPD